METLAAVLFLTLVVAHSSLLLAPDRAPFYGGRRSSTASMALMV